MIFRSRKPDIRDETIVWLREQNSDLMNRLQELVGIIHQNQAAVAQMRGAPENAVISGPEASWMSEEEADLRWQYDHGYIGKAELEESLGQLGFENTVIEFHTR